MNSYPHTTFPEAIGADTAVPLAVEDWLPPLSDRKILVIRDNEDCTSGKADRLVHKIMQRDAHAALHRTGEQGMILNSPATIDFVVSGSDAVPHESGKFDLVICALISSYVEIENKTLFEIGRVLSSDGCLLIIDYLVPGSRLRGRKARQLRMAGDYINTWTRLRNSRHKRYLDQDAWIKRLTDAQWNLQQTATREVPQDFDTWAGCYSATENNRVRLRAMLVQAPENVHRFLTPESTGDRIAFRMTELFILAKAAKNRV